MIRHLLCTLVLIVATKTMAQPTGGPPQMPNFGFEPAAAPAEPDAIPLYGAANPGKRSDAAWSRFMGRELVVRNVTFPTLTPVLPNPRRATGAAVIVAPGGAFMMLSLENEGWRVARALADRGITAFILQYRLVPTPADPAAVDVFFRRSMANETFDPMNGALLKQSHAPADARAALAMIRAGAVKWRIDPARVGIIGFSAGAMTARRVAIDAPGPEKPAFIGYIYGPQDAETVPADAPPLFNAIALDDMLFPSKGFPISAAWQAAKRPVEIHGYQRGNHGFGLGQKGTTSTLMLDQFVAWMDMNGFLKAKAAQ
jgi:dienelactone hydrolase